MRTLLPHRARVVALALTLALAACGDDSIGTPSAAEVEIVTGDAQTVAAGGQVILTVRALDGSGSPIAGSEVSWTVLTGDGSLAAATTTTDAEGEATNTWTVGTSAGAQSARATAGTGSATFTATVTAGAADALSLTPEAPTLVSLGETVQLTAVVSDEHGNEIPGATVDFDSSNDAVATVDGSGLVTAVADGEATVTATSGSLDADATVTVSQQTSTLQVSQSDLTVNVGSTATLTVSGEDANGNVVAAETFSWSADPGGFVTLDERDDGAEVDVTGDAEGSTTLTVSSTGTGSVSGTVAVTVEPAAEFEPTEDTDAEGTLDVTTVVIPAGVTLTATGDLTINASGVVQIDGDIVGDCVNVTIAGATDVTLNGDIDTSCTTEPTGAGPALNLFSGGTLVLDGSTLTLSGDLLVTNDADEMAAIGAGLPAAVAGAHEPDGHDCTFRAVILAYNAPRAPDGVPGGHIGLVCNGDATFPGGNQIAAQHGGHGTDDLDGDNTVGTDGQPGGGVRIESTTGDLYFGTETHNGAEGTNVATGEGGRGGDAEAEGEGAGGSATATAGNGGDGGAVSIGANNGTVTFDGMDSFGVLYGNGGRGGDAVASGVDGGTAPTPGGSATATAGDGGDAGGSGLLVQNTVGLTNVGQDGGHGGRGGHASAFGGVGGAGVAANIDGADGGAMTALAGNGGASLGDVSPALGGGPWGAIGAGAVGNGGDGGNAILDRGQGGDGYDGCCFPFSAGGNGGKGGDGDVFFGGGGDGAIEGSDGSEIVAVGTGDGGDGGNGAPPGMKGLGGSLVALGGHPDTFRDGMDGGPCTFTFIVEIAVLSDPNGHEPFIGATSVTEITVTIDENGDMVFEPTEAWGSDGWTGTLGSPDGTTVSFTSSGSGTVAGYGGVNHTFEGTLDFTDDPCAPTLEGVLTLDSEGGELPGDGQPTTYQVNGTS